MSERNARERLTCDLERLEQVLGRYSTALVILRLLRDLGTASALLDSVDAEINRMHTRYLSEREAFEEALAKTARNNGSLGHSPQVRQHLDELLLASRRAVHAEAAAAFMPDDTLLRRPELPLASRRAEFLSRFAFEEFAPARD